MISPLSYEEFSKLIQSEKAVLVWVEPSVRLLLWTLDSGAVYKRSVSEYVVKIFQNGTELSEASSTSLNSGEWFFDYENKELYIRTSDDSNPQNNFIRGDYRLFFSDRPSVLSHDLNGGDDVYYEPLIEKTSSFSNELDLEDQIGIALESKGKVEFLNPGDDDFWGERFDKYFFEGKIIKVFSWSPLISETESRLIFSGVVENKTFTEEKVGFRVKDFAHLLKKQVPLKTFSLSDGNISQDLIGKPKRRIYGRVEGILTKSIDQTLDGFSLGTISGAFDTNTITGSGFLTKLSKDDEFFVTIEGEEFSYSIERVDSDTSATLADTIEKGINSLEAFVRPTIPVDFNNRNWLIAGHKLRAPTTTISEVVQSNRIKLADTTDLFENDEIKINGTTTATIKRISGDLLILNQNLPFIASVGMSVTKTPLDKVYFNSREFKIDRDWTLTNGPLDTDDAIINFNSSAEFNVAPTRSVVGSITFTNGSRNVTGSGTKFLTDFKPNDYIKNKTDLTHQTWYKIVNVLTDESLDIRTVYGGTNFSGAGNKKNVDYFGDTSLVSVNCDGKELAGEWKQTASRMVEDLLIDAGIPSSELNPASFEDSEILAPYILSMALPFDIDDDSPTIREVINRINRTVIGSIVSKDDFQIHFDILSPERPFDVDTVRDDDVHGWDVKTKTDILRKIKVNYRHFDADRFTGEIGTYSLEETNDFVDNFIGLENSETFELYFYDEIDAETMGQRILLMRSLTQSTVTVSAKLRLGLLNLNDKLVLSLDRIYKRFGDTANRRKMGIISKIRRSSTDIALTISDLGNLFNRVGNICDDSTPDFTVSDDSVKIKSSYIVDDDLEVPDVTSEDEYGVNLIG
jgi:hypothetical protein